MAEEIDIGDRVRELGERVRRTIAQTEAAIAAGKLQRRMIRKPYQNSEWYTLDAGRDGVHSAQV